MKRRLALWIVIPVALVVATLSGCASPTAKATGAPPKPTPHVTSAPKQAAAPSVRVSVKCADLFSAATVSSLVDTPVTVQADESTGPVDLEEIASRQRGTLGCIWGGAARTDGGYDEGLTLYIASDAAAAYGTNIPLLEADSPPTAENTAGDKSEYVCEATSDFQCSANMLVGNYWVSAYLQNVGGSTITSDQADSRIQQVLATVAKALRTAKDSAAWVPPASTLSDFCSSPESFAKIETILGTNSLNPDSDEPGGNDAQTIGESGPNYAQCGWNDPSADGSQTGVFTYVDLGILRGGAWSLAGLTASPPTDWYLGTYKTVTVAGASSAVLACNTTDCAAMMAVAGNVIQVNLDDVRNTTTELSTMSALVAAIQAS